MSFFFGGGGSEIKPQYTGIQLQTSSSSQPITIMWGANRLAPNIIWYGDFKAIKQEQKAGKGGGKITSYTYRASLIMALCQGPINSVNRVFRNNGETTEDASTSPTPFKDQLAQYTSSTSVALGTLGQAPWGYLSSSHPSEALGYSGIAYVATSNYDLGQSASTPQHNFEVFGRLYNTGILLNGDADPALVTQEFLSDPDVGCRFTESYVDLNQLLSGPNATTTGDSSYQTYCRARGISFSPILSSQESGSDVLDRWARLTDTAVVWTGYSLKHIPYCTEEITGNGYHYTPNLDAVYTIDDSVCLAPEGEIPIKARRTDPSDANNSIKLKINNRENEYNQLPVEWKDQGLIDLYGERQGNSIDAVEITDPVVGALVVSLIGQREAYNRNEYEFTLPPNFCRLEPMDPIIVIDPELGQVPCWVMDLEEDEDYNLNVTAKEVPPGFIKATNAQSVESIPKSRAAPAGPVNTPILFQPPLSLTDGITEIWSVVSGGDNTDNDPNWGGCFVYISLDDATYSLIGEVTAPARQGKSTAALAAYSAANPDTTNTLAVNMSLSDGILDSITSTDVESTANLAYIDGEIIGFRTATLTGANAYDLTTLDRALYGTSGSSHSSGTNFARLDDKVFRYELPPEYIGKTLYLKFQSYNVWRLGIQDLADCTAYSYSAASSPIDSPTGLNTTRGDLTWRGSSLDLVCDPVAGAASYQFDIYKSDGTTLVRTLTSLTPSASYSALQAAIDTAYRTYKVKVKAISSTGASSSYSSLVTVTNNAPAAVSSPSISGGSITAVASCTDSSDPDLAGYVLFFSTTSGFNPLSSGSVIRSGVSSFSLYGLSAGTYYGKLAAYDGWSSNPADLNLSSEISFTITTGGGTYTSGGGGGGAGGGFHEYNNINLV